MQEDERIDLLKERYCLASERIDQIPAEDTVPAPFSDYFKKTANFLILMVKLKKRVDESHIKTDSLKDDQKWNDLLYHDILPGQYEISYANPEYAVNILGEAYGRILSFLYTEIRGMIVYIYEQRLEEQVILMELFIQIYNRFEIKKEAALPENCQEVSDIELMPQVNNDLPAYRELQQIIYWFVSDYSELFVTHRIRETVDPDLDFAVRIIMDSDLNDLRYLYQYGEYVSENELKMAEFMNSLSEEEISLMADTFTEGYRIGFAATGKDISIKKTVNIRYHLGFERMIRRAIENFQKMNIRPVIYRAAVSTVNKKQHLRVGYTGAVPNPQYDYDHRFDNALYLDKKFAGRKLEIIQSAYESYRIEAKDHGGPAVVEVFGETPFSPCAKAAAFRLSKRQQKLLTMAENVAAQITDRYIPGKERSFTIISFPVPEIGERFEEIFRDILKINTLDSKLYQRIQQKLIDVLDQGTAVRILGRKGNRTDLTVSLIPLEDPEKQSIFENCVADVNIPVGEVFTSPKLEGTSGVLNVKQVYLESLNFNDLEVHLENGMVTDYGCSNFDTQKENRKYVFENVLFGHESLPIGEFAIGTNTAAYVMARKYDIAKNLPVLIAEKTGPHFALGDTCYNHQEDTPVYNPDGKEVIARDNEITLLRKEDASKAYFGCHTDITIPYEEIGLIEVTGNNGRRTALFKDGRFVLEGTEELNRPLDEAKNLRIL